MKHLLTLQHAVEGNRKKALEAIILYFVPLLRQDKSLTFIIALAMFTILMAPINS